jgi:hypothetical protein
VKKGTIVAHFVFPKWTNALLPALATAAVAVPLYAVGLVWYGFSPVTTDVGYEPTQVVPFSHKLHAGDLGIDCRYCHNTVERAAKAAIPPTQTCMNCHHAIHNVADSANDPTGDLHLIVNQKLQPLITSYFEGTPVLWRRVHDLPDYAYFDHSAHITRGVSCVECHGRIDRMDVVSQQHTLSMGWCLDCHRNPDMRLRDPSLVTKLDWIPGADVAGETEDEKRITVGRMIRERNDIHPSTDCSTCHR